MENNINQFLEISSSDRRKQQSRCEGRDWSEYVKAKCDIVALRLKVTPDIFSFIYML